MIMEYYPGIKNNKILTFVVIWMGVDITPFEITKTQNVKHHIFSVDIKKVSLGQVQCFITIIPARRVV
jgi:hypothetical protein